MREKAKPEWLIRHCPKCGKEYVSEPAISRTDNKTKICPTCGITEALDDFSTHAKKARVALENAKKRAERTRGILAAVSLLVAVLTATGVGLAIKYSDWPFLVPNAVLTAVNFIQFLRLTR